MVVSSNPSMSNVTGDLECSGGLRLNNQRQKLRQRFDIVRKLGQGTYGKVQLATNKDSGEEVAIKTIKKAKIETEQDLVRIQREIQIMSSVQHPHIIHIYEVFENKEKIVLVMEYACGGELYDYLSFKKSLSESDARRIFRQVVSAVFYCHKNKICHRDLKLENILLDEKGNAKIADFGLSNIFDEKKLLDTFCGSPLYASPEIVKGTPYYGPEVDCWSLGVLLYTLVYGAMPFDGSNFRRLVKQISDGDYYEPKKPSDASRLIRRLLTVSPSKRASIEDVCDDWWVNLGYDDCLLALAEDMCKATPVRLDYLLQLATPALSEAGDNNNIDGLSVEEVKSAGKLNTEENLNIQREIREDAMDTDIAGDGKNGEVKKHQLTASELSASSMTESSAKKRQKTNKNDVENKDDNAVVDAKEVKIDEEVKESKESEENVSIVESTPVEEEPVPTVTPVPDEETAGVMTTSEVNDKDKLTIVEVTEEKPDEAVETKPEEEKKTSKDNEEAKAKPKLKPRSASLKTPDKLNLNVGKDGKETKKSLLFPALKVSEARRAFESKPPEKRSVVIPGLKVSAARKAFEAPSTTNNVTRRASMPAKLAIDKTRKQSLSPQPEIAENTPSPTPAPVENTVPLKMTSFLPTLDVTMAVKPKKDAGKPPPVPRMDVSTTSGTSSGENTPDDVPKPPPQMKIPTPRRASYPKTSTSVTSSMSSVQDTERTRTVSESDSLSLNAMTTSSEQSLKSSTSTLTGGDSLETWGSMASVASNKDLGTSENSIVARDECKSEERDTTPEVQVAKPPQTKPEVSPKVTKVSSMEIKLNSDVNQTPKTQMAEPQLVLRQAPGGGKFTLLGVTSEVTFDVAAAPPEDETCETATVELKNEKPQKNSNLFMSVTLPPPPPPDGNASSPESERPEEIPPTEEKESESPSRPKQYNRYSSYEREDSTGGPGERFFREISKDAEEMSSSSSHQGYSVYRSKFRSLQKAFLGEESSRQREPSVEHSESFSSTGSTDELEDIFDSLATGDSMLSNILGRTRSIIEEFARDDIAAVARRHGHSFLRRIPGMPNLRSSDLYSKLDSLRSYADNVSTASTSGIGSSRSSRLSRQPPSDHESSGASSRSAWRSARTQSAPTPTRDLGPEVESYLNDSTARSRWYTRSTSREEEAETNARSNTSQRRSMYTSSFSRSMSRSISEEDTNVSTTQNVDGKNDTSSSSTSSTSQYHATQRDNASSLSAQKRSSLSSRFRSGCCPPGDSSPPSSWSGGYARHHSWAEDQEQNQQQQYQYSSSSLNRNRRTSASSDTEQRRSRGSDAYLKRESTSYASGKDSTDASVYGTIRRPKNISRYGRASTQELMESGYKSGSQDEDSTSGETGRPRRPRSLLVLSDSNEDNTEWSAKGRKESGSGSSSQQRSSHRMSTLEDATAGTSSGSGSVGKRETGEGVAGDVKKKSEAESESRSGLPQNPRINRFGFRRTPSQERTFESVSACPRETPTRDQIPIWRASSHGREIPSTQGGSSSWSRSRFADDNKPGLVRRASLSEAPKGRTTEEIPSPGGAAGYWAKRYGTTSRVPPTSQRRASAGKAEDNGTSGEKKSEDDGFKSFLPSRRRSMVGFESDSEMTDELDRTRGLLRYARSISHEMDQLQNDLCARFGMINRRKKSEEEAKRKSEVKSDVEIVVDELKNLEDDLLKFNQENGKSNKDGTEPVSEVKTCSESESKEDKSNSKEDDPEGSEDGINTPTDMEDSCSICSDYEGRSAGGSGLDESVSERIRRKSYFARFQDSRRKHHHGSSLRGNGDGESVTVPVHVKCRHQVEQSSNKTRTIEEESEEGKAGRTRISVSAAREVGNGYATLPKISQKRNHFLETKDASPNERSVSPEANNNNVNGNNNNNSGGSSSPQPNTKESTDTSDNKDGLYRHLRAGSVVPEMMEPGASSGYSSTKSFLRQRSACDPLRPTSPLSRRLSMLDSSPISNGDVHPSHHLPSSWSSFERRKSRPLASIISSLPLEATVQSRAKLRSRHDYLINRALSTLDERYTRPLSPTSRRSVAYHDNHASPPSDLRRFSAILDNASPRDVIRKALDVCNSLQY